MTSHPEREFARLRASFYQRIQDLADLGFVIKGSLLERSKRCSSPGCACQTNPERWHGPFWQWTSKVKGKTVSRTLKEDQVRRYREWMDNSKRLEAIVQDLYDLSDQADAILRTIEHPPAHRGPKGHKKRSPS